LCTPTAGKIPGKIPGFQSSRVRNAPVPNARIEIKQFLVLGIIHSTRLGSQSLNFNPSNVFDIVFITERFLVPVCGNVLNNDLNELLKWLELIIA
jgi:hypothetical protein